MQGYQGCLDAGATPLAMVHQRALRYIGLAMFDHNRIYRAIPTALWQQLHQFYAAAEALGIADSPVSDSINQDAPNPSCASTYLHTLLAQHATPDALTLAEMTTIERWLRQWAPLVTLTQNASSNSTVPPLAVVLGSGSGARGTTDLHPSANVRYMDLGGLSAMLTQMIAGLRNGKTPAELALGAEPRQPACENLLLLLNKQWCGAGDGRGDERSPSSLNVLVSLSIAAMHFHLTGRAFRQPGSQLSKREEDDMQMFGHVSERTEKMLLSQRSGALETWEIINHSSSGFLGMCRRPDAETRLSHKQLLGLRTATGKTFYLGIVQRLIIDDSGAVSVGLRVIPGAPQPIAVRIAGAPTADGKKYDRALLMPEDNARKIPASLIVAPTAYQPNRAADLYVDAAKSVKLVALLDKGVNFERATFNTG
jgi:cyclic-di-GMP-binding protein